MQRFVSQKFKFYSFISIALLLFVHGYNLQLTYLEPTTLVKEKLTFTTFIEYFLANGLLRFRLPMLFIISGYIYAAQDNRPYGERIKKRFTTLIIPYLIWGAFGLALTFLFQQFPVTAQAVKASQLDQLGDNRPYTEIGFGGILHRWLLAPVSFQLWFIRSLFVYNLMYPIFKWAVLKIPLVCFGLPLLMWVSNYSMPFAEGQGMFFFALGIWLNKKSYPIDKKPEWYSRYLSWLFFAGTCTIKTFMAFEFEEYDAANLWTLSILHVITCCAGVVAIWYSLDRVVKWFMRQDWFRRVSPFAFFIYGFHIPLLAYIMWIVYRYCNHIPQYRLLAYILVPSAVLLFSIFMAALVRSLFPKAYRLATGGRGF